jgi:hypothetical protein
MNLFIQSTSFSSGSAWIAATVVGFLILFGFSLIPFGEVVVYIFSPVFVCGYMLGCVAHKEGGSFEFRHMFEGFKAPYFKRLAMLGVFYTILILTVVILIIFLSL